MATRLMRTLRTLAAACALSAMLAACATTSQVKLTDLTTLQQQADSAYARHDWHTAASAYAQLAQRVPDNAAYWFRLGNSFARLDAPESAVGAYRAALQRDPHIAPAWHNLGSVLLQQAEAAYQQATAASHPGDPLRADSALLARRIAAVRAGTSVALSAPPASTAPAVQSDRAALPSSPRRRGSRDLAPAGTSTALPMPGASTAPAVQSDRAALLSSPRRRGSSDLAPAVKSAAPVITPLPPAATGTGGRP